MSFLVHIGISEGNLRSKVVLFECLSWIADHNVVHNLFFFLNQRIINLIVISSNQVC
jgi:hypothetical protein